MAIEGGRDERACAWNYITVCSRSDARPGREKRSVLEFEFLDYLEVPFSVCLLSTCHPSTGGFLVGGVG